MNWYSLEKLGRYFHIDPDGETDDEIDIYESMDQAEKVFNSTGIHTNRDKQISQVVMPDEEDRVVGALADEWRKTESDIDGKTICEYSFDLSVLSDFQKQGIGRQLIHDAISKFEIERSAYEEMGYSTRIKVWAINPNVARILENEYGFDCDPVAHENGEPTQWMCFKY